MTDLTHDQLVQRGPIAIAVREYGGSGPPVLLLHGGARNLGDWAAIAPRLTSQHRVVALDFRSHGASTPCDAVWSVADAIDDVQAVITALQLGAPWLAGHSLGGMVATRYAAEQRPCRGVVNIDGVGVSLPAVLPGPDPDAARQALQTMIAQMAEVIASTTAAPPAIVSAAEVAQQLSSMRKATIQREQSWDIVGPTAERAWYRWSDGRYQENPSPLAIAALSQAVAQLDIFALTRRVRCPLLFLEAIEPQPTSRGGDGATDLMQTWREGVRLAIEQIAQDHPNVAWRGLQGDHMLVPNQAAAVADALLRFIGGMHA